MAITIRDLLQLNTFEKFELVTKRADLSRIVTSAGVLDFEFAEGVAGEREAVFESRSLVLSSLLFAKDDPDAVAGAVDRLIAMGVSGLAYKSVFFDQLPPDALERAERAGFPIFRFDDTTFFENIIFEIMSQVQKDSNVELTSDRFSRILESDLPRQELLRLLDRINPALQKKIRCAALRSERGRDDADLAVLLRRNPLSERTGKKTILCKYGTELLVVLSADDREERLRDLLGDVMTELRLDRSEWVIGTSLVHDSKFEVRAAADEARQAAAAAQIEGHREMDYGGLGLYQMLLPEAGSAHVQAYMRRYLGPVLVPGEEELLRTAVQYILSEGDLSQAAQRLFCHKNTVRYRMGKLRELLDPASAENTFYERLAAAVRIYLIGRPI